MKQSSVYCRSIINYAGGEAPLSMAADIHDARRSDLPGWQHCGFERMQFASAVTDWADQAQLQSIYLAEIEAFARGLVGCDAVLFYPPLYRSRAAAAVQPDLAPIEFAHSDYTEGYQRMIGDPSEPYHAILKPSMERAGLDSAAVRRAKRVLTLQLWRNVGAPDCDFPLAFCDARTVPRERLVPIRVPEYGGLVTEFDAFALLPPSDDEYRWYTFPQLTADEVVVFRAFDSDCVAAKRPFWTPHTSFRDTTLPADAAGRESVEARAVCLFF